MWLLGGVRQGLSLGALTGFQFEEQLHEQSLDIYVQPFRDAYPLVGDELTPDNGQRCRRTAVGGRRRREAARRVAVRRTDSRAVVGHRASRRPATPAQIAVIAMLEAIDDMLSALSDVSIAESVFQIMRGNYGRVGGILDAVSRGDHPPDPDIVTTPRPGLDVTHRLMLLLAGAPPARRAWRGITRPAAAPARAVAVRLGRRAAARPRDRAGAGDLDGGPAQPEPATVSLRDLDIGPLDVLALADAADRPQRAELESSAILLAARPPADATRSRSPTRPNGPARRVGDLPGPAHRGTRVRCW